VPTFRRTILRIFYTRLKTFSTYNANAFIYQQPFAERLDDAFKEISTLDITVKTHSFKQICTSDCNAVQTITPLKSECIRPCIVQGRLYYLYAHYNENITKSKYLYKKSVISSYSVFAPFISLFPIERTINSLSVEFKYSSLLNPTSIR